MIRYLIVDDEHIAHDIIKGYCDMLPNLEFKANCYDAIEAIDYLSKHEVDLIFLDLNMPKLKGFEFLKTLSSPPKVIVTTAYREYAIESYELNVVDYLLKPFSFERFLSALNKVTPSNTSPTKKESIESSRPEEKYIFLKQNNSHIQVDLDSILLIEASGNYTKVFTTKDIITIREKLSDTIQLISQNDFIQVHKSFAVAKKQISRIEGNRIHISDHIVPIGKLYKANINQLFK
ncbi:LytR/AlgR family response regulator transcription factor [Eudoraea chungangensis]|uniref:LytR/AlgR family response regulator transcription factor n=1 Tax=Eudoraea chungangensis TaxID=1481905 RepID=UPI0023EBC2B2|nr:response regulator transcription factor [Eudoraea chungangensis]